MRTEDGKNKRGRGTPPAAPRSQTLTVDETIHPPAHCVAPQPRRKVRERDGGLRGRDAPGSVRATESEGWAFHPPASFRAGSTQRLRDERGSPRVVEVSAGEDRGLVSGIGRSPWAYTFPATSRDRN